MSRYAALYANPQGAGDVRPTAMEIVEPESLIEKTADKAMLITGRSASLGLETARAFHAVGAKVFLTGRDLENGRTVVDAIRSGTTSGAEMIMIRWTLGFWAQ